MVHGTPSLGDYCFRVVGCIVLSCNFYRINYSGTTTQTNPVSAHVTPIVNFSKTKV